MRSPFQLDDVRLVAWEQDEAWLRGEVYTPNHVPQSRKWATLRQTQLRRARRSPFAHSAVPRDKSKEPCPAGHEPSTNRYRDLLGHVHCKQCHRDQARKRYQRNREPALKRAREWREKNPERARQLVRKYRQKHPELIAEKSRRRRARKSGVEATLTRAEWSEVLAYHAARCVWCGQPYEAMDHVIPLAAGGPHSRDNVAPACTRCNTKKRDLHPLVFLAKAA